MSDWKALTDNDRKAAFESMPDMLEGFLKTWGWLHFAKAIEARCKELNSAPPSPTRKDAPLTREQIEESDTLIRSASFADEAYEQWCKMKPHLYAIAAAPPAPTDAPLTREEIAIERDFAKAAGDERRLALCDMALQSLATPAAQAPSQSEGEPTAVGHVVDREDGPEGFIYGDVSVPIGAYLYTSPPATLALLRKAATPHVGRADDCGALARKVIAALKEAE